MAGIINPRGSEDHLDGEELEYCFGHFEMDGHLCHSAGGTIRKLFAACISEGRISMSRQAILDLGIEMTRLCAYALGA